MCSASSDFEVTTRFMRFFNGLNGRLSHVLRPMMIAPPVVSRWKNFRSSGACHGMSLPRPIAPFFARPTISVIMGYTATGARIAASGL